MSLLLHSSYAFPQEISEVIAQTTEKEDADERLYISIETEIVRIQSLVNDSETFLQNAIETTDTSGTEWGKHLESMRLNYRDTITNLLQQLPWGRGIQATICEDTGRIFYDDPYQEPRYSLKKNEIMTASATIAAAV